MGAFVNAPRLIESRRLQMVPRETVGIHDGRIVRVHSGANFGRMAFSARTGLDHDQRSSSASAKPYAFGLSTLLLADDQTRTLKRRVADILYFFFPVSLDRSRFSFTLNSTIWRIRSKGIGLSNRNTSERFGPS